MLGTRVGALGRVQSRSDIRGPEWGDVMWPEKMTWLNPPPFATRDEAGLHVITADRGDFWRDTYYGFRHDTGHALLAQAGAEFSCEVRVSADYTAQYDQAGLMIRSDAAHWIKAGVEFVNGHPYLATVVTLGKSDWSQMPLTGFAGHLSLRLTRIGDAIWVQYRLAEDWAMFRLAHFPPALTVAAGPATCSPTREGLQVTFQDFYLGPARTRQAY